MTHTADMELARGVVAAERDAFDALFDRYADRVHALAHRHAAQPESVCDLTERMLERVLSDLALYRGEVILDVWVLARCRRVLAGPGAASSHRAQAPQTQEIHAIAERS